MTSHLRIEPRFLTAAQADIWLRLTAFWLTHRDTDPHQLVDAITAACLSGHGGWATGLQDTGPAAHSVTLFGLTATGPTSRATAVAWRKAATASIRHHASKRADA